jgi:hypothetical protein
MLEQIDSTDEVSGNYKAIFKNSTLTREQLLEKIVETGEIIHVDPLVYFTNVGNGMNVYKQKEEIDRIIAATITDPKDRGSTAINYIKEGNQ